MVKFLAAIIVLTLVYLFIPRYELLKAPDNGGDKFEPTQQSFWSRDACHEAGAKYKNGHRCMETNAWEGLMGKSASYAKAHDSE